jgi:hypothetical protein
METIDQLLGSFAALVVEHAKATEAGDFKRANKAQGGFDRAVSKLRSSFGELGEQKLVELAAAADDDIACMAAAYSLRFNTALAETALKRIAKGKTPAGFAAKQCLKRWESGEWDLG